MQILNVRQTLGTLVVSASLIQGCTMPDGVDIGADTKEVIMLSSSKAAVNNSYVADSGDRVVMTAQNECLRTINWDPANSIGSCADAEPVVAEPQQTVEPGSALVSYNGRALFDFDSATLSGAGEQQLDQLTAKLNAQDDIEAIEIVGHADSIGSDAYNQTLSENRANAVKLYLQRSLRTVMVRSKGLGESAPIADNNTDAGRRLNRRVDVNIAAMVER